MPAPSRWKPIALHLLMSAAVIAVVAYGGVTLHEGLARADARRAAAQPAEIKLPAGRKLAGVSWRCYGDYPCRPYVLTRAMRKDEAPEAYDLFSTFDDAPEAYVIKESR